MGIRRTIIDTVNTTGKILTNHHRTLSILLITGLALTLRIHHLDHESLWVDEIHQTSCYDNSLTEIIDKAAKQAQPPLDYWIGHFVHFVSSSEFAVRMPAALFGTGSVLLLVMLISQISSWSVAYGFGIVAALLPFNLYYSQEARPYAIAVFLFLCVFWVLNRLLSTDRKQKLYTVLVLLFFAVIFLHSRALSPLVIIVCLLLILVLSLIFKYKPAGVSFAEKKHLIMLSCGAFIAALLFYLPSLKIILLESKTYVHDTSLGLHLESLKSAIINFDLKPIWQAYVVQSEPITYPLLVLVGLSPFLGWYLGLHRNNTIWAFTTLLLPIASLTNLIIFQSKTDMSFRPPYASYILPLTCILGAISVQGLWNLSAKVRFTHLVRSFILILAALFVFQTIMSAINYKAMKRKSDWRGVAEFVTANYDSRHVLILDSFSRYGSWEPKYYGFPRYYRGQSIVESMQRLPLHAAQMPSLSLTPILILFQWRDYYLTSQSHYPIMSNSQVSIDYQKICRDPGFICTEFTGFSLIQLRERSDNLARDTYKIIEKLLWHTPDGSWEVELHLAAAALTCALELDKCSHHLRRAEEMVPGQHHRRIKKIANYIRRGR